MTRLRRGDVVLVRFPYSNLKGYKKRPALIVQDEGVPTGSAERLLAMITTNLARRGPSRVLVRRESGEGRAMGLRADSLIVADHLATVEMIPGDEVIGRCPAMGRVDAALRAILGL